MSKKHYRRSPSGATRAINCPASVYIEGTDNQASSVYAEAGTLRHDWLENWLLTGDPPDDAEARELLRPMYEHCVRVGREAAEQHVEVTLESQRLDDWGGTPDHAAVSDCGSVGWVDDFKWGEGVRVVAEGNDQLMSYASLLSEQWTRVETWFLSIWQPRVPGPPADTVEVSAEEVAAWTENYIARTDESNRDVFAAGDWCRWCRAVSTCPHLYAEAKKAAAEDFSAVSDSDLERDKQIDRWLYLESIEGAVVSSIKQAKKNLHTAAVDGYKIPGRKLVTKYGNRRWAVEDEVLAEVCMQAGIPLADVIDSKYVSPTRFEKLGHYADVEHLVERPEVGLSLVSISDGRPEIHLQPSGDEFSVIQKGGDNADS